MKINLLTVGTTLAFILLLSVAQVRANDLQPKRAEVVVKHTIGYLLYLPKDYEEKQAWPLVLFLHGSGERGDDLEKVKIHGPPKQAAAGREFPFILVAPQCPLNQRWDPLALTALLDDLTSRYKVDQDRIYVTGLSMGGYGTWSLAIHTPDRFAAIAPICGGGDRELAGRLTHLPIWVFHGANDAAVPLARSEEMVAAVKKAGGDAKLTVYPDAGHDSWTETYDNPEFYGWLLKQKRNKQKSD